MADSAAAESLHHTTNQAQSLNAYNPSTERVETGGSQKLGGYYSLAPKCTF